MDLRIKNTKSHILMFFHGIC